MSSMARRVQWLFPVEREVYRVRRGLWVTTEGPTCVRCGARMAGRGLVVATRVRGTYFKGKETHAIHRRCVPTAEFTSAGVPARKVARKGA